MAAQKSDKQHFIDVYNAESDAVFRYCFFRTSDREIALDITQETFMRYWDTMKNGAEAIRHDRALLFTIARRLVIDWYRKKKTVSLEAKAEEYDSDPFEVADESSSNTIEMDIEARHVIEKIKELDETYRHVIYLRFVEDMKPQEIADVLEVSANVVSVRINRGLKELRKIINP